MPGVMNKDRIKRYKEKITVIETRRNNIFSWISETDEKSVLAAYKAFQELVDSLTLIFAMMLKDMGEIVGEDYSNIEALERTNMLNQKQAAVMKEANGLRNRLIHEYNGLERQTARISMEEINDEMEDILTKIRSWIKKHFTR